jgi:hypothetical protein
VKDWLLEIGDIVELTDGRNVRVVGVIHDEHRLFYCDDSADTLKEKECSFDKVITQFIPYNRAGKA